MAKYNLTVDEIERMKGRSHSWWADFKQIMSPNTGDEKYYIPKMGEEPTLLTTDTVFETEKEILKGIATEESCVIAGRSGFFVLKKHPNRLSILIQASMEHRIERVMRKQGLSRKQAEDTIKKVDTMRENYVMHFAKTSRYDTRNYDLVISMDGKDEDSVVELIEQFIG